MKKYHNLSLRGKKKFMMRLIDRIHPLSGLTPYGRRLMAIGWRVLGVDNS
jgi:hypothetical protein